VEPQEAETINSDVAGQSYGQVPESQSVVPESVTPDVTQDEPQADQLKVNPEYQNEVVSGPPHLEAQVEEPMDVDDHPTTQSQPEETASAPNIAGNNECQ